MARIKVENTATASGHVHSNFPSLNYVSNIIEEQTPATNAAVVVNLNYGVTKVFMDGDHALSFSNKPLTGFRVLREIRVDFEVGESFTWPAYITNAVDYDFAGLVSNGVYSFLISCEETAGYILKRTLVELPIMPARQYDVSQVSTVIEDGAHLGYALTVENAISPGTDDITQATADDQFAIGPATLNGFEVLVGDGTNWMQAAYAASENQPIIRVGVMRIPNLTFGMRLWESSSINGPVLAKQSGSGGFLNVGAFPTALLPTTSWHVYLVKYNGVNSEVWIDDTQELIDLSAQPGYPHDGLTLGASYTGTSDFRGDIAEFREYTDPDADPQTIIDELQAKWGI